MGLLNAISEWRSENYKKKVEKSRFQGKCPDCNGNGFHPWVLNDMGIGSVEILSCNGCEGTGLFSDWEAQQI